MNPITHKDIVYCAIDYMREEGGLKARERLAELGALHESGLIGVRKALGNIALDTDHFSDMAVSACLGGAMHAPYGHHITSLNHFVNIKPLSSPTWGQSNGYYYQDSSKASDDHDAMAEWIIDVANVEVDDGQSPVLNRLFPYWMAAPTITYSANWDEDIRNCRFAPVSVLAQYYYSCLMLAPETPVTVGGHIFSSISGIGFLGPVLHAIADCCVPQHVRGAMGFHHQDWENIMQARREQHAIVRDSQAINQILQDVPFLDPYTQSVGPLAGRWDLRSTLETISAVTADHVAVTMGIGTDSFWQQGSDFWDAYMVHPGRDRDMQYFFSLATAASVYALHRAYDDMVATGFIESRVRPHPPHKLENIALNDLPPRWRHVVESDSIEMDREAPLHSVEQILGRPARSDTTSAVFRAFSSAFDDKKKLTHLKPGEVLDVATRLEDALLTEWRASGQGRKGLSLTDIIEAPYRDRPDLHPMFGLASFRLPTLEECDQPTRMRDYLDASEVNSRKGYFAELTVARAVARLHEDDRLVGDRMRTFLRRSDKLRRQIFP